MSLAQGTQTMLMLNPDTLSYSDWLTHNSSGFFGVNKSFIHLPLTHLFLFSMFRPDGSTHPPCLIFHNESKIIILILFPCTRYQDLRDNRRLRCYSGVTEVTGVLLGCYWGYWGVIPVAVSCEWVRGCPMALRLHKGYKLLLFQGFLYWGSILIWSGLLSLLESLPACGELVIVMGKFWKDFDPHKTEPDILGQCSVIKHYCNPGQSNAAKLILMKTSPFT